MWGALSRGFHSLKRVAPPRKDSFLNLTGWEAALPKADLDYEFIISGVRDGFHIVDSTEFEEAATPNYSSALAGEIRPKVEKQILSEIIERTSKDVKL